MASIIPQESIHKYIPQRPPFVMVDKLYAVEENSAISGLSISSDNILNEGDAFQESGLIENMAQTCALFAGYKAAKIDKAAPVGFIAGVKNVTINRLPKVKEQIKTRVEIINEVMNMQIAKATVFGIDEEIIASSELRIFIREEEAHVSN